MGQSIRTPFTAALVVQNQALVHAELASHLSRMGLVALAARDANEALVSIADNPDVGLVVSDIKLSGATDGVGLAHRIRSQWPAIKIILTSGWLGTEFSDLPPGAIFVSKPYRPEAIQNAVAYLAGRSARVVRPEA